MKAWTCLLAFLVLAGCTDPPVDDGEEDPGPPVEVDAWECDYELDDYAGGQPRLMVHWDVDGERAMSGIEFRVDLQSQGKVVATHFTQTDCSLFDMTHIDSDKIIVNPREPAHCDWGAVMDHEYGGDFETVRIDLEWLCG